MWAAIVIISIAFLLVLAAPKPKVENARAANLGDFQFPRSKEGDPVPWFRGTVRLRSPNSLWYGDYTPVPIKKKQKTGLFSSKKVTVGYKYHIGLDLCWALGGYQTVVLRKLWSDKYVFWQGEQSTAGTLSINLPNLFGGKDQRGGMVGSIEFYPGSFSEAKSAYLANKADADVPAYIGQCRTVFKGNGSTQASGFYFGTTTNINAINAEASCYSSNVHEDFSIMPNGWDVNPMELLHAGFTQRFGMIGVNESDIDLPSWRRDAETLFNENMGMSLLVQQTITGKDLCEEVLRIADGILYQDNDTGKMVSCLIRQDYEVEDLPVFDQSVVKELVNFTKTTWDQAYNQCRVTFKDRANEYADRVAIQQDFALINFQQKVRNTDISVPGCFVNSQATDLATRQLSLMSVPLFQIEIRCNRRASLIKPGQCFVFNWAPYGISNMVMRVQKIDKGTLTDGVVTINAVQDRFATALAVFAPPTGSGWVNPIGPPQPMTNQALFELPYEISSAEGAIVATLGGRPGAVDIGYLAEIGDATDTYTRTVDVTEFTPAGTLATSYPANTDARDATGFAISSVQQSDALDNATEDEVMSGSSVALIRSLAGDELVAWKNFDGSQVSDVIRGIFGSVALDHASGAKVFFITDGFGLANKDDPYTVLPRSMFAKFLTYNGMGQLDPTDAIEIEVDLVNKAQRPAVPGRVRVNGAGVYGLGTVVGAFVLAWAHRSRLDTQVRTQDDASVPTNLIETGMLYNIRVYNNTIDSLIVEGLNGNASNANIKLSASAEIRVELTSVRNGLESYSKQIAIFDYDAGTETTDEIIFDETSIIFDGGGA